MSNGMRPVHPGEILADEVEELGLSANALANALCVPNQPYHGDSEGSARNHPRQRPAPVLPEVPGVPSMLGGSPLVFNVLSEVVLRTTALDVGHIFWRPARNFQINAVVILPHPEHLSHVGKGIGFDSQPNQMAWPG